MMELKVHTTEQVLKAVREAALWESLKWDSQKPRSCLRTLEFSPDCFSFDHFYTVNDIIYARKYALEALGKSPSPSNPPGQILVYEPSMNISDGLSEGETGGFFDVNDCPPWDLWVGFIRDQDSSYVLSWIPEHLVGLVNKGSEVNCVDCFYWLNQCSESWAQELRDAV